MVQRAARETGDDRSGPVDRRIPNSLDGPDDRACPGVDDNRVKPRNEQVPRIDDPDHVPARRLVEPDHALVPVPQLTSLEECRQAGAASAISTASAGSSSWSAPPTTPARRWTSVVDVGIESSDGP